MAKKRKNKTFEQICSELKNDSSDLPSLADLRINPPTNYPLFGFKYLKDTTHKHCNNGVFFVKFLERLNKLSSLGWKEIEKDDRHSFGTEKIDIEQLYPEVDLPPQFKKYDKLTVFRATGDNHVFAGIREHNTFHIFFIESEFGKLYDHD